MTLGVTTSTQILARIYVNPTSYIFPSVKLLQRYTAIATFYKSLKEEASFEKLFITFQDDRIGFWILIDPDNYDNEDKVMDLELQLRKSFPEKKFSFTIIGNSKSELARVPKENIPIE